MSNISWRSVKHKFAVTIYNFVPTFDSAASGYHNFLSILVGEEVIILEECLGWFRGYRHHHPNNIGIFPSSFVHILDCLLINEDTEEAVIVLNEDPVIHEATESLRYWRTIWKNFFLEGNLEQFQQCTEIMSNLIQSRRNLMKSNLPFNQKRILRECIIALMESGNRELGVQLIPRDAHGRIFDIPQHGFADLYLSMHSKFGDYSDNLNSIEINVSPVGEQSISQNFHHLFFSLRTVVLQMLFDTEMFVSIYNASLGKRISEQYRVCMDQKGVPKDPAKLLKTYSIFINLESNDIAQDLYLMIEMVRFGPFETREAEMIGSSLPIQGGGTAQRSRIKNQNSRRLQVFVRRPYAVGLYSLSDVFSMDNFKEDEDIDLLVTMYHCIETKEAEYHNIPQHIFSKNDSVVAPLGPRGAGGVFINLKALHGTLEEVKSSNSYLFTNQTAVCERLSFPDIILPEMKRNDVYIRLKTGNFPKYTKKTDKNVEIEVLVKRINGSIIPNCIYPGIGEPPLTNYLSTVFYHNGKPFWNDVIKLSLETQDYGGSFVEFLFRHRSNNDKDEKPFSIAFLRLLRDDGTIIGDGDHEMMVYKAATISSILKEGEIPKFVKPEYKDLKPSSPLTRDDFKVVKDHIANRESFVIETISCSTMFTKNINVLNILSWQKVSTKLVDVLNAVKNIPDEDMVLFLDEMLSAIFRLLNEEQSEHHSSAVDALIHLLSLLAMEKKYFHFKKYLDQYCEKQFHSTMAYKAMLVQSQKLLKKIILGSDFQESEYSLIRKFFKAFTYFFKFVVKSRLLHVQAGGDENSDHFESQLFSLLDLFIDLIKIESKDNIFLPVVQALAIQNIPYCFDELTDILPPDQLSGRIGELMSVGREDKLVRYRLIFILHTVRSSILLNDQAREILFPKIIFQIGKFLQNPQLSLHSANTPVATNFLYSILCMINLYSLIYGKDGFKNEIQLLAKQLMPIHVSILQNPQLLEDSRFSVHLISTFIGLLDCIDDEQFSNYMSFDNFPCAEDLENFMSNIFDVISSLLEKDIYPINWLIVKFRKNYVFLKKICSFSDALDLEVLCITDDFGINMKLWISFFILACKFCFQPELQLENLSEFARQNVLERYGDMRITMVEVLLDKWKHIEKYHHLFVSDLFAVFLRLSLLAPSELRALVIPIFFDIIKICFREGTTTFKLEAEFIDKFDTYISGSSMGDSNYVSTFNSILIGLCHNDEISELGTKLVNQLTDLLVRLIDFKTVERQFEAPDIKMKAMFNLLSYYKEMGRDEMYIRYIYRFCKMLVDREYFLEAGYTLLLHADVLGWNNTRMKLEGNYPYQTESERKENLYIDIIDYFDKGKMWEFAIDQAKKLSLYYEKKSFNYKMLSAIHKRIAGFYAKIVDEIRASPEYFRVGFYGRGFPKFIQNSQFIYRGLDYENLQSFNERLSVEFPNARIMKTLDYPNDGILESNDQYLQSCKVDPIGEMIFSNDSVNEKIRSFYKVNDVNKFRHSRPFHKGDKDKNNEFKTLWLERTVYSTGVKFPGLLKSFPVVSTEVREISPIEYALETVHSSTSELKELILSIKSGNSQFINQLSMRLNGIIDAAVMGGLKNYEEAFFTDDYLRSNPDNELIITNLKEQIREQIEICQDGIRLHGKLCEESLFPFHHRIESQFSILKKKYYTGYNQRISSLTESIVLDLSCDRNTDTLEPQLRHRENSYSSKYSRSSARSIAFGKQISITGKVHVKTSLPTKLGNTTADFSEIDVKGGSKPTKPPEPLTLPNVSEFQDLHILENFNLNNSTSSC